MNAIVSSLEHVTDLESMAFFYYWGGRADVGQNGTHNVYSGPLRVASRLYVAEPKRRFASPTAVWPDDLAWAVAMHTDSPAVYVGGSEGLVAHLRNDDRCETVASTWNTEIDDWNRA
jgi:hypothetical protein